MECRRRKEQHTVDYSTGFQGISAAPATIPGPKLKASIFDEQSAWSVYKTQFEMSMAANGWSDDAKAYNLAAFLRGEAADVQLTIPEDKRTDFLNLHEAETGKSHQQVFRKNGSGVEIRSSFITIESASQPVPPLGGLIP